MSGPTATRVLTAYENSCPNEPRSCGCLLHVIQRKIRWKACPRCSWRVPVLRGRTESGECLCARRDQSLARSP